MLTTWIFIGVVAVGALFALVGLYMLISKRWRERAAEGTWREFKVSGPVGAVIALGGVALIIVGSVNLADGTSAAEEQPPRNTQTSTPSSASGNLHDRESGSERAPARTSATFSEPASGDDMRYGQDVRVRGQVTGLPDGAELWIVTTASHGGAKYYLTSGGPILVRDGTWSFVDPEVGDSSDVGGTITYHAVQANTACSRELARAAADGGDPPTVLPPRDCVDVATVELRITE